METACKPSDVAVSTQPVYILTREDLVIRVFFSDVQISSKIKDRMNPDLFKDQDNRTIATIIKKFERKYDRVPTAQELITGMGTNDYAIKAMNKLIVICNTPMQALHTDYIVNMVETFFQERLAELVLMNAAEAIHDKNAEAIRTLINPLRDAVNFSLHLDLGLNIYSDAEAALEMLKQRQECIPSAINDIRYYTGAKGVDGTFYGGGYYRKTLTLYVGQPNVGKSLVLCSEAANAYMNGYNTLYISLELSEDYVWRRIASNLCDTDFYAIPKMTADEYRAKVDAIRDQQKPGVRKAQLQVKRLKSTTTPAEIETMVDSFEIAYGKLDFLVIDYIGIMKPSRSGRVSESNMYADGVAKAEQIRDMLIERNIAGLSAVQFNRNGYHNLDAGIEAVEGSSGYSETCDVMISIVSDEVLRSCHMMYHSIMKNRLGPNMVHFVARCSFETMRWFSPTMDELSDYNEARANADVEINSQQGMNRVNGNKQNGGIRRSSGTKSAVQTTPEEKPTDALTVHSGDTANTNSLNTMWDGV